MYSQIIAVRFVADDAWCNAVCSAVCVRWAYTEISCRLKLDSCESRNEKFACMMTLHKDSAIAKQSAVSEYVTQLVQRSDGKFLVFAHHLAMLDAVAQAAQKAKVCHLPHKGV